MPTHLIFAHLHRANGSHRGLTDWYDENEQALKTALQRGPSHVWTTGWYSSKHEIASAKITADGDGYLTVEASVTDDFDTPGMSSSTIPWTDDLETIAAQIDQTWQAAEKDREANQPYVGFSVGRGSRWEETLILPSGDGFHYDTPPGDNYHEWGWQRESDELTDDVREKLLAWADEGGWYANGKDASFTVGEWTIRKWA
jgi:hypothetical protein